MKYTLNDYYQYCSSMSTRVEIYPDKETAARLLARHKKNEVDIVAVGDCVDASAHSLPMPGSLMTELDKKITTASKRVIVIGIDAYLSLLNEQNVRAFMVALHGRIDAQKLNAVYLISVNRFDRTLFTNPKYENSMQIVQISGHSQYSTPPYISIVAQKWIQNNNNPTNFNMLLNSLGYFEPTGEITLVMDNFTVKQAGLSDNVYQLLDIKSVAARFYGIDGDLNDKTLEALVAECRQNGIMPFSFLELQFGKTNIDLRLAVKRLLEMPDDELWSAYVWLLRKTFDTDSYLADVLRTNVSRNNLLRKYIVETAVTAFNSIDAAKYALERAVAIKEIGNKTESFIIDFIASTTSYSNDTVACWLNCGTEAEHTEIVRRVSGSDLVLGLPEIWRKLYVELTDYLSNKYDYGNKELTSYFAEYRKLKIKNDVNANFVKKAFDFVLPSSILSRDSVLQELSDDNTALLVVDGMGAEYYPLILAIAKRRELNVEFANVVAVNLPTLTEFNLIKWNTDRRINGIYEVDNIAHNGAAKHEYCSFERNIVASLNVFADVFNRIVEGLTRYERVVVTADHGSSRLAVLAHNNGLSTTLTYSGEPLDWRYALAIPNAQRPPEFESYYNADENKTYWIVRGYNRLPKKGPKLNEIHGGATLEEQLVPIVIFTKLISDIAPKQLGKQSVEQLVEKKGFDIDI